MKRKHLASSRSSILEDGGEETPTNQLRLGDLIWARLRDSIWWPAQVVDANTVSDSIKPCNRSVGEVLVRLYGSYKYLFVDPVKSRSEFQHVLKQNNGSYREIFQKSLDRDLPHSNSARSKRQGTESKEVKVEALIDGKLKIAIFEENQAIEASKSRIAILEEHPDRNFRITRARKASLVAESLKDDVSEIEGMTQNKVDIFLKILDHTPTSPSSVEEGKSKTTKEAGMEKKLKPDDPTTENEVKEASVDTGVQNKRKNGKTPERDDLMKKHEPCCPKSAVASPGKSQELSDRRVKVMQSLGLVAPPGSPFKGGGQIYPFCD